MKVATISETKNRLSALLDRVRHGDSILIVDRTQPVALLVPVVSAHATDPGGRVTRLERAGLIRRGTGGPVAEILRTPPPRPSRGGDVLEALLRERREGR